MTPSKSIGYVNYLLEGSQAQTRPFTCKLNVSFKIKFENLTKLLCISTKNTALCADALARHTKKAISVLVINI